MSVTTNNKYEYRSYNMGQTTVKRLIKGKGYMQVPVTLSCDYLAIQSQNPYKKGKIHGKVLKDKIGVIYKAGKQMVESFTFDEEDKEKFNASVKKLASNYPDTFKEEMRGLSKGAEIPYQTVVEMNALPVIFSTFMACTALVGKKQKEQFLALSADNGRVDTRTKGSRGELIESSFQNKGSLHLALQAVNQDSTIRAKVFDPSTCSFEMTTGIENAAMLPFMHFSSDMLFGADKSLPVLVETQKESAKSSFCLAHNLDFQGNGDIGFNSFGENQLILVRTAKGGIKTASLTFPGMIGINEGINSDGLSISCLTHAENLNDSYMGGAHNHFVNYELLSQVKSADAFLSELSKKTVAAPLNLVGCDATTAFSIEWQNPGPNKQGWDYIKILQ